MHMPKQCRLDSDNEKEVAQMLKLNPTKSSNTITKTQKYLYTNIKLETASALIKRLWFEFAIKYLLAVFQKNATKTKKSSEERW